MEIKRSAFGKGDGKAGNGVEVEALSVVRGGVETIKERGGGKGDKGRNQLGGGLLGMVIGSRFRSRAFAGLDSVSAGWPVEFTLPRDPEFRRRGGGREATSGSSLKSIGASRRDQRLTFGIFNRLEKMMASIRIEF